MKEIRLLITPTWDEYINDTPERNLLTAVLSSALHDLRCKNIKERKKALEFFFPSELKKTSGFTFEYCCQELDIDPNDILNVIKKDPSFKPIKIQRVSSYKKRNLKK